MSSYDEGFEEGAEMSRRLRDQALRQANKELSRLRAEVERLTLCNDPNAARLRAETITDLCNESRELRAELEIEKRAVERLAGLEGRCPPHGANVGAMRNCTTPMRDDDDSADCPACRMAWARSKEVPNE